jgi:hypothetical protein
MNDFKYPKVDYSLCPKKESLWVVNNTCMHQTFLGKCTANAMQKATCPPVKKYIKDLRELRKKAKKEANRE